MKKILALSLSLFVLANAITVSQTQAIPKPVKVVGKVAGSLALGFFSLYSTLGAICSYRDLTDPIWGTLNEYNGAKTDLIKLGALTLASGIVSSYLLKSAYNDVQK